MSIYSDFVDVRSFVFFMIAPSGIFYALIESYGIAVSLVAWGTVTFVFFIVEKIAMRAHIRTKKGKVKYFLLALFNLGLCAILIATTQGGLDYFDELLVKSVFVVTLLIVNIGYGLAFVLENEHERI